MAWRALRTSVVVSLRQFHSRVQQAEGFGEVRPVAARLLSSAPDAQSSGETQPPADAAAGAAALDSQQQQQQPAPTGNEPAASASGANGDVDGVGGERRRKRSRFYRDQQSHAARGGAERFSQRSSDGARLRGDEEGPVAKIKVQFPVRVAGFGRLAGRRDVQRLLADCHLQAEDVRLEYDPETLNPKGFWANLPTRELQERALAWDGAIMAGRPITVVSAEPIQMQRAILNPLSMGSRGRYVLMLGIQENANLEDVVRFFENYELMGNPVTVLKTAEQKTKSLMRTQRSVAGSLRAVVRFARTEEAHRAVREKQGAFILNAPIMLRVLQ